jgi:uncharacterized protein (TIGR00251 family)
MEASGEHSDLVGVVSETRVGVVIRVRVKPRSRRHGVFGINGSELSVAVGAPPEKGRANSETLETLAGWLGLPASRLSVVSGAASRSKRVSVAGIDASRMRLLIAERLGHNPL